MKCHYSGCKTDSPIDKIVVAQIKQRKRPTITVHLCPEHGAIANRGELTAGMLDIPGRQASYSPFDDPQEYHTSFA